MLTLARPAALHPLRTTTVSVRGRIVLSVTATALVALAAHVSIPLPFSPVPLTLQPFAVLLVGLLLGPATAFATMLLYLGEGAAGLPVFSPLGPGGVAQLLGPTGGFLLSYPLAAATAGWLVRNFRPIANSFGRGLIAATVATAVIFLFGASWLAILLHLHLGVALRLAVLPFLPGESIKILAAATLYSAMHPSRHIN